MDSSIIDYIKTQNLEKDMAQTLIDHMNGLLSARENLASDLKELDALIECIVTEIKDLGIDI